MLPACHLRVDLGLLAGALVEASEIRPHRNDQCAHRVRVACDGACWTTPTPGSRTALWTRAKARARGSPRTSRPDASDKRRAWSSLRRRKLGPSHWGFFHRRSRAPLPSHSAPPKNSPSVAPKNLVFSIAIYRYSALLSSSTQ